MLWTASRLMPARTPAPPVVVSSESSGAVAVTPAEGTTIRKPVSLFRPGYFVVVAILIGGVGLAVHLRRREGDGVSGALPLRTLGQMQMAPQQQLRLVSCGEDVLLLGVTAGQITLLKSYPKDAFPANEGPETAPAAPPVLATPQAEPFAAVLRRFARRHVNAQASQSV